MPGRSIFCQTEDLHNQHFEMGQIGVNKGTEYRIKNMFRQTGSVKNRPKSGQPKSTTAAQGGLIKVTAYR